MTETSPPNPVESGPEAAAECCPGGWRWPLGVFIAAALAWTFVNFPPIRAQTPEHLQLVDMYSPAELQKEAEIVGRSVVWQNTMLRLGLAGFLLGTVSALFAPMQNKLGWIIGLAIGIIGGVACGLLGAQIAISLRGYFAGGGTIPLMNDPMIKDTLLFAVVSFVLCLPVAIGYFARDPRAVQKSVSIVAGGMFAGILIPFVGGLLLPAANSADFPPGLAISALWLGLIAAAIAALPMMTGARKKAPAPSSTTATA